jgi:hypothetical protein
LIKDRAALNDRNVAQNGVFIHKRQRLFSGENPPEIRRDRFRDEQKRSSNASGRVEGVPGRIS